MTISATTPQRNATATYGHRQTKSGSAINCVPLSHPKYKPHHHQAHQIQSPPPKDAAHASKSDSTPHKKRRRQRKPKDIQRQPSPCLNTSGSPSAAASEPVRIAAAEPKTPTKTTDSTPPGKVYAGPGFHHSPAPSSLPVPKFFSKSMPSNRSPGLQAMMEEFDNTDESTSSSPPSDAGPLDVLFRAHRKELAERRGDASSDSDSIPDTPGRDIFGMDPDSPIRPRFKTPRNNAGRMTMQRSTTDYTAPTSPLFSKHANSPPQGVALPLTPEDAERQNKSAALRQMLLQRSADPTPLSPSPIGRSPQVSPHLQRNHASPPDVGRTAMKGAPFPISEYASPRDPVIYQNYSPVRPQFSNIFDQWRADKHCRTETNEMTAMENSLRQILKLDPRVEGVTI